MKKKVYISGAIAHYDLKERMATFDHAARYLSIKGYEPANPFENGVSQEAHWMEHMRVDIALLLKCDCIYMLQGWELSKGAKPELDVAYGNNPHPLKDEGECCPECNLKVLSERIRLSKLK